VASIAATTLTFTLVWLLAPAKTYVYELFFERSWIQHATTFCFWLTMATLALKSFAFRAERAAYALGKTLLATPALGSTLIWSDADMVRQKFADSQYRSYHHSITFTRILHALDRLRKTQSTKAIEDYCRTRSDIDASELESSYAGIRYLTWLIPTLGFIGTVMGIGVGIAGFAHIIQHAQGFQEVQQSLPIVTQALGTAFDTTLLALGLSAVVVFYMSFLLQSQEQLLESIDNLCFDEVCALFQEHSTTSDEIVQALRDFVQDMRDSMNGNRAEIVRVIRHELPVELSDQLALRIERLGQGRSEQKSGG
jgi:biopolymer transport protein ExbB/TolQ